MKLVKCVNERTTYPEQITVGSRYYEVEIEEEKGWTITYIPWEDMEGNPRVAGRFKTTKEKDEFLEKIHKPDSGWLDEEFATLGIINDYYYMLLR